MAYRYDEAINDKLLDEAVRRVIAFRHFRHERSLMELVDIIVPEVFCLCVTNVSDAMEGHRSQVHAAIVSEVLARIRRKDKTVAKATNADRVEAADEESFPASDPPSWIYSH